MPYMRVGNCVYKKNPDGSRGEKRGCSDSAEMAEAHMRALYAHESSKEALEELERGLVVEKEEYRDSQFLTTKEQGKYRWTLITGSAFEDRDGEIISEKAFQEDCDVMELTGDYGELLWWHCDGEVHPERGEKEARPYIPLGKCDTSLVYEKLNIESGTYYDDAVGAAFAANAGKLGASKAFYHKAGEPVDGVFSYIRTKERSLLPRTKEANLLTRLFGGNKEKEMADNKQRVAQLIETLGEEDAKKVLEQAKAMSEQAEAFLKSKEAAGQKQELQPQPELAAQLVAMKEAGDKLSAELKAATEGFQSAKEAMEKSAKDYAEYKAQAEKDTAELREDVAKLSTAVSALLGIQPKGAERFLASKDGKVVELTEEQKKKEKEALGQADDGFGGLTSWLISGKRPTAA